MGDSKDVKADNWINVANGKNSTTYMTSNANTGKEGFLYVGNGFSNINTCNESLQNGNNLLGKTSTTGEVALYVDLQDDYDISIALIYQGSTNAKYYIQISDDASDWKTVSVVTASGADTVQIEMPEKYSARYVRMYASKRGTAYGVSFYEMGVWEKSAEETTTKPTEVTTAAPTTEATITQAAETSKTVSKKTEIKIKRLKLKRL